MHTSSATFILTCNVTTNHGFNHHIRWSCHAHWNQSPNAWPAPKLWAHLHPLPPLPARVAMPTMPTNHPPWVKRHSNGTRAIPPPHPECLLSTKQPWQDCGVCMHRVGRSACQHFAVDSGGTSNNWHARCLREALLHVNAQHREGMLHSPQCKHQWCLQGIGQP